MEEDLDWPLSSPSGISAWNSWTENGGIPTCHQQKLGLAIEMSRKREGGCFLHISACSAFYFCAANPSGQKIMLRGLPSGNKRAAVARFFSTGIIEISPFLHGLSVFFLLCCKNSAHFSIREFLGFTMKDYQGLINWKSAVCGINWSAPACLYQCFQTQPNSFLINADD